MNELYNNIQPKRAERIFPFREDLNEVDNLDAYDEDFIENTSEEDTMSIEEQAFMIGYLEA